MNIQQGKQKDHTVLQLTAVTDFNSS